MAGRFFIGVSGWRYAPWRGHFYPPALRQQDELAWLSRAFPSVEINGSFYSLQRPSSWRAWAAAVPDGFIFSVKGPRFVTHVLRLKDTDAAMANFFASGVLALGAKLGPLLWQLPPNFAFDPQRIDDFLGRLPRTTQAAWQLACRREPRMRGHEDLARPPSAPLRHALEVRHPSFLDPLFIELLREHGVAAVLADTPEPWPEIADAAADFAYLRLHGAAELYRSRYDAGALRGWARRIRRYAQGGHAPAAERLAPVPGGGVAAGPRDVYCYFDNTDKLHAPENAGQMVALLGVRPRGEEGRPTGW